METDLTNRLRHLWSHIAAWRKTLSDGFYLTCSVLTEGKEVKDIPHRSLSNGWKVSELSAELGSLYLRSA